MAKAVVRGSHDVRSAISAIRVRYDLDSGLLHRGRPSTMNELVARDLVSAGPVEECYCGYWVEEHENPCPDCGIRRFSKRMRGVEAFVGKVVAEIAILLLRWSQPTLEELNNRPGRHKYWTAESLNESRLNQQKEIREDLPGRWRLRLFGTPRTRRCLVNLEEAISRSHAQLYSLSRDVPDDDVDVRAAYSRQIDTCLDKLTILDLFRLQNKLKPLVMNGWTSMTHEDCLARLSRLEELGKQLHPAKPRRGPPVHEFEQTVRKHLKNLRQALVQRSERIVAAESATFGAADALVSSDTWFEAWIEATEFMELLEHS